MLVDVMVTIGCEHHWVRVKRDLPIDVPVVPRAGDGIELDPDDQNVAQPVTILTVGPGRVTVFALADPRDDEDLGECVDRWLAQGYSRFSEWDMADDDEGITATFNDPQWS